MKILVRCPNWIGDQVLAYPFFYYLRKTFPSAKIVAACSAWVGSVQFRKLVDQVYILPKAENASVLAKWKALEKAAKDLREDGPWDLGFCLPNSFSSAWLLTRSGVKRRCGYAADGRSFLLSDAIALPRSGVPHRSEAYAHLLFKVASTYGKAEIAKSPVRDFWGLESQNPLDPRIPGVLSAFDAEKEWAPAEKIAPPSGRFWVLAPGSTAESRRWPRERFAALARRVAESTGWSGIIVGGPAEGEVAHALASDPDLKLIDSTGKGSVASYWKVFRQAEFTLANDSGLAHIASLCGGFVYVVWGAGDPRRTEPQGPGKVRLMMNPVECWPCESNFCSQPPGKALQCLNGISPDGVWKGIQSGLETS